MPFVIKPRVKETWVGTGTGTYTPLAGAVTGYQGFSVIGSGNPTDYVVTDNINWEHSTGTVSLSPTQVTRATVLDSSNGGAAVNWGAGTKEIFCAPHPSMISHSGQWPSEGACRLDFTSATVCTLSRLNGLHMPVIVNGVARYRSIPSAGITLANTGLVANTTYYVYCPFTGNLEASTTVPVADADTGIMIKTGDATRSLVGMLRTEGSTPGQFQANLVLSWFNQRNITKTTTLTLDRATASATFVLLNAQITNGFLTWGGKDVLFTASGTCSLSAAGGVATAISIDSTTVSSASTRNRFETAAAVQGLAITHASDSLSEGFHQAHLLGATTGGSTGTWHSADDVSVGKVKLGVLIQG